ERLRAPLGGAFPDLHDAFLLEYLKMTAQVAVGERTQLLQVVEQEPLRMHGQRRDDSQACPFVQHTLQAFVSEAARMVRRVSIGLLHDGVPGSSRTSARP